MKLSIMFVITIVFIYFAISLSFAKLGVTIHKECHNDAYEIIKEIRSNIHDKAYKDINKKLDQVGKSCTAITKVLK